MSETVAQAAVDEVKGKSRIFVWTHKEESPNGSVQEEVLELVIPRKFKRFKFARRAGAGNYVGALEVVFGPKALEPMEEWEMDEAEWEGFMEALGEAISGTGNS